MCCAPGSACSFTRVYVNARAGKHSTCPGLSVLVLLYLLCYHCVNLKKTILIREQASLNHQRHVFFLFFFFVSVIDRTPSCKQQAIPTLKLSVNRNSEEFIANERQIDPVRNFCCFCYCY